MPDALRPDSLPNPLWQQNPGLMRRFSVYRDRTAEWCQAWRASEEDRTETHDEPFESRLSELRACTNVFDLLTREEWNRDDLQSLDQLLPLARCVEEFDDWFSEGERQIVAALHAARSQLGREPRMIRHRAGGSSNRR
jgi:hypothetical protein